ncbi:MAG TPA: hypothetical protein VM050_08055 [Patescibacteria group bacterium]|nr:hypothetical protein [Patescibacteria group bacterium]
MSKSNTETFEDEVLESLINDPTRSIRNIAKDLDSYRQKVWRQKKRLEEENVIWGYTAVLDESKLNHFLSLIFLKIKPMDENIVSLIRDRIRNKVPGDVRIINALLVNGEYDLAVMFSAKDRATSRRYFDSIRLAYDQWLLDKPLIVDVNLALIREGKVNPELDRLEEFIPRADQSNSSS